MTTPTTKSGLPKPPALDLLRENHRLREQIDRMFEREALADERHAIIEGELRAERDRALADVGAERMVVLTEVCTLLRKLKTRSFEEGWPDGEWLVDEIITEVKGLLK